MKEQGRNYILMRKWEKGKVLDGEKKYHAPETKHYYKLAQAKLGTMSNKYRRTCKEVQSRKVRNSEVGVSNG